MLPDPLHPFVGHFPIVLPVAPPISALWAFGTIAGGPPHRRAWPIQVSMVLPLTASPSVARETGEAQANRTSPWETQAGSGEAPTPFAVPEASSALDLRPAGAGSVPETTEENGQPERHLEDNEHHEEGHS